MAEGGSVLADTHERPPMFLLLPRNGRGPASLVQVLCAERDRSAARCSRSGVRGAAPHRPANSKLWPLHLMHSLRFPTLRQCSFSRICTLTKSLGFVVVEGIAAEY